MSKDITEGILLRAEMYKVNGAIEYTTQVDKLRYTIQILDVITLVEYSMSLVIL